MGGRLRISRFLLPILFPACVSPQPGPATETGTDAAADTATDTTETAWLDVQPHPTQGSLLVATWNQTLAGETALRWSMGDESHTTSAITQAVGEQQRILAGVPYGSTVTVDLLVDDQPIASTTATTDPLPENMPRPTLLVADEAGQDPDLNYLLLSTSSGGTWGGAWWTAIIDRQGRVVWARQGQSHRVNMQVQTSTDGHDILIDQNSYWGSFDNGVNSQVDRVKLDGTVLETVPTPGLHHPFTELPDGRLAWGAIDGTDETLAVEQADGSVANLWSCRDFLAKMGASSNCGSNTLRYDADRGTFLFSFFTTQTVFEIDATTGSALRWFGHLDGSYTFDPDDSAFWWQHGVHWTDAGTLLVSTKSANGGHETMVREYQVDDDTQTLTQIWSFGEGQGIFAADMGEAWRLQGGNTLHNYGTTARVREVTSDGQVVWDLIWADGNTIGRMTALSSLEPLLP
ncbi:MAG: hypothetical protein GXP62_10615 [Oligoflexia bacterium]|nr:hypothetical protein [Oligoflexia bacterium]